MQIRESTVVDFRKIRDFMELVDPEFVPPLSQRPGGINGRISGTLSGEKSNFILAITGDELVGAVGYEKDRDSTGEVYMSFIAVHPEHRKKKIARTLDGALVSKSASEGYSRINVTTWSTNPGNCELYRRLGYGISKVLKNHRGPGIDTIYFRKNI